MKKKFHLLLFALLFFETYSNAQYPGYSGYQRKIEAQRKIEEEKKMQQFYDNLPFDTAIKFRSRNFPDTNASSSMYRIPLKYLKAQKEFVIEKSYQLKNTTVYFTGYGFPVPQVWTINSSIVEIDSFIQNKCGIGTFITFDAISLKNTEGKELKVSTVTYIVRSDDVKIDSSAVSGRQKLYEIVTNKFSGGIIYFAKAGFPVARSIPAAEILTPNGQNLLDKTMPGTEVTFDNCSYWDNVKKTTVIINKTIGL